MVSSKRFTGVFAESMDSNVQTNGKKIFLKKFDRILWDFRIQTDHSLTQTQQTNAKRYATAVNIIKLSACDKCPAYC